MDIQGFGINEEVPIELSQDVSPEDELLKNSDLGCISQSSVRTVEMCTFNPNFPELDCLKSVVMSYELVEFQTFDKECLRVSLLKLKVHPGHGCICKFSDAAVSVHSGWNFKPPQDYVGSVCI